MGHAMRILVTVVGLAAALWSSAAWAEGISSAGHEVSVAEDGMGSARLLVDGAVLHEDGVIYLDSAPLRIEGATLVTGAAGVGGNACNAAPFVLVLPETGAPEFWGPVESCAYLVPKAEAGRLVFASDPLPGTPGESWIWTRTAGFAPGPAVGFTASAGWEGLAELTGEHPASALAIAPVLEALEQGLGADCPAFAERISGLGSGDLTGEGYLGRACLKFTCEADWAMLYLHSASEGIFAAWQATGETEPQLWPEDASLWPAEAMAALRAVWD